MTAQEGRGMGSKLDYATYLENFILILYMIKFVIKRANVNDEIIKLKQTSTTKKQYLILIISNVNVKTKSLRIRMETQEFILFRAKPNCIHPPRYTSWVPLTPIP